MHCNTGIIANLQHKHSRSGFLDSIPAVSFITPHVLCDNKLYPMIESRGYGGMVAGFVCEKGCIRMMYRGPDMFHCRFFFKSCSQQHRTLGKMSGFYTSSPLYTLQIHPFTTTYIPKTFHCTQEQYVSNLLMPSQPGQWYLGESRTVDSNPHITLHRDR